MSKRVYIPNKALHDYSGAWDFGELIFCTQGELHRLDVLTMQAEIERSMADAEPDDYILISSLTSLCSIACAAFASRFGCLNLLIFDNGKYHARSLNFGEPSGTT